MLGNLSIVHIMLLLLIVVLIFGTGRVKNLGRDLGGAINGFKQAMREGEEAARQTPPTPTAPAPAPQTLQQTPPDTLTSTTKDKEHQA